MHRVGLSASAELLVLRVTASLEAFRKCKPPPVQLILLLNTPKSTNFTVLVFHNIP